MLKSIQSSFLNRYFQLTQPLRQDVISRLWYVSSLFLLGFTTILIPVYFVDERLLSDVSVWLKPIKFSLSLSMHFITMAILLQQVPVIYRSGKTLIFVAYAAVASMLLEQIYISIQAGRGRLSHFNFDTPFEITMYSVMGIGALLLVIASFVLGILIWRKGDKTEPGLRLGSILGLTIGSVLTLIFAGYMSTVGSHLVGNTMSDANGMIVTGWSRSAGDLRVAHFFATHLIQIIPFIGWLCDRLKWPTKNVVLTATIGLILICVGLFVQALSGTALLPM